MSLLVRSFVCCVLATGARGPLYPPSSNVTVVYPPPAQTPPVVIVLDDPAPPPKSPELEARSSNRQEVVTAK
jgi:hypothetical protein